jgi:hypothetical protein
MEPDIIESFALAFLFFKLTFALTFIFINTRV